jgi:hypothetical protein
MPHGEGEGLGDPQAGLEEHQDEQGVPVPLPPPATFTQPADLGRGQVGHYLQGPGRQAGLHGQHHIRPPLLLSRYPPEMAGRQRRNEAPTGVRHPLR